MKVLRIIVVVLLFIIIQGQIVNYISFKDIKPDLVMIVLVYLSLKYGPIFGTLFGFTIGLVVDSLSPFFLGLGALCKSWIGFSVGTQQGKFFKDNPFTQAALIFVAFVVHDILYLLVYTKLNFDLFFDLFLSQTLFSALYTGVIAPLLIYLAKKIISGDDT